METLNGPIAQLAPGHMVYHITLASGMIITNPFGFSATEPFQTVPDVIVSESGQVISKPESEKTEG